MDYGQSIEPVDAIKSILKDYPLGISLFREFLQNSDDAGASKQIFVLDGRTLESDELKETNSNGPALICYNDAFFSERDWEALRKISRSSKHDDTSKIGKYGKGFRSCFHITDAPQIISGSTCAIFGPGGGGQRHDLANNDRACQVLLASLDILDVAGEDNLMGSSLPGSAIRLPLRQDSFGELNAPPIDTDKIRTLLLEFIKGELHDILLFLRNIRTIEIWDVNANEKKSVLGTASLKPEESSRVAFETGDVFCTVRITSSSITGRSSRAWHQLQTSSTPAAQNSCIRRMKMRLPDYPKVSSDVKSEKLIPGVGIAIPSDEEPVKGRLFAHLPLPIFTGYPGHIHGVFALTSDRQHLINQDEVLEAHSKHRLLVEWNKALLEDFAPLAWAKLVDHIVNSHLLHPRKIYDIWPNPSISKDADGQSNATQWQQFLRATIQSFITFGYAVWPTQNASNSRLSLTSSQAQLLVSTPTPTSTLTPFPSMVSRESLNPTGFTYVSLTQSTTQLISSVSVARKSGTPLSALAQASVTVVIAPNFFIDVLNSLENFKVTRLAPESAKAALVVNVDRLQEMSPEGRSQLLCYLLSSKRLENITNLPLLPMSGGGFHALAKSTIDRRVLLNHEASELFAQYDPTSISIEAIPTLAMDAFRCQSLDGYNVCDLSDHDEVVMGYLRRAFSAHKMRLTSDDGEELRINVPGLKWLIAFWTWVNGLPANPQRRVMRLISKIRLVPLKHLCLSALSQIMFYETSQQDGPVDILLKMGIRVLHSLVLPPIRSLLASNGEIHSIRSVNHLLPELDPSCMLQLPTKASKRLRLFLLDLLQAEGTLTRISKETLRKLPVFPLLQPTKEGQLQESVAAVNSNEVMLVNPSDSVPLPRVDDFSYVIADENGRLLTGCLDPKIQQKRAYDIVALGIERFQSQSLIYQRDLLNFLVENRNDFPAAFLNNIQRIPFIPIDSAGSLAPPSAVVSPSAIFAEMVRACDRLLPHAQSAVSAAIIKATEKLGLFITTLTSGTALSCMHAIHDMGNGNGVAGKKQRTHAEQLLGMLDGSGSNLDYSKLLQAKQLRWIPVDGGNIQVCTPEAAKDARFRNLCDLVTPVCTAQINSPKLLAFLAWNVPIELRIIRKQFTHCLAARDDPRYSIRMWALMEEFAKRIRDRDLNEEEIHEMKAETEGHAWIPIDESKRESGYTKTQYALIDCSDPDVPHPFCRISPKLFKKRKEILRMLGCKDRITLDAIQSALRCMRDDGPIHTYDVCRLMEKLCSITQPDELRQDGDTLILGADSGLYPHSEVFFNDIHAASPPSVILAHPNISARLAKSLGLAMLSERPEFQGVDEDDEDMHEDLSDRISGALRQYRREQIFLEFLANAVDAGASTMTVIVDETLERGKSGLFLPSSPFHKQPALIFHNDAQFRKEDFMGIRKVGVGSKRRGEGKIGRFGLGALSAYHFSDVMIIISGKHVLFLDPSQRHFTSSNRKSRMFLLSEVRRLFPEQLVRVEGLQNFGSENDFYGGTLMILPLRSAEQAKTSTLSQSHTSVVGVLEMVEGGLSSARDATTFLRGQISLLAAHSRHSDKKMSELWSVRTTYKESKDDVAPEILIGDLTTSYSYKGYLEREEIAKTALLSLHRGLGDIPQKYDSLFRQHALPDSISIGVALRKKVFGDRQKERKSRLFAYLPLPVETSFSADVHGSFILADDRRSIRFDQGPRDDHSETSYNKFLLKNVNKLYLAVMHHWHGDDQLLELWPDLPQQSSDGYAPILRDSLFESLPSCTDRLVLNNLLGIRITPATAVLFTDKLSPGVKVVASQLLPEQCVEVKATHPLLTSSQLSQFNEGLLIRTLDDYREQFLSLFREKKITINHLLDIISYILEMGDESNQRLLDGLPLVPLEDGNLCEFQYYEQDQAVELNKFVISWPHTGDASEVFPRLLDKIKARPVINPPFPLARFLHRSFGFFFSMHKLPDSPLNIRAWSNDILIELLCSRFKARQDTNLTSDETDFISLLWDNFDHLHSMDKLDDRLSNLPLIRMPTNGSRRHVSINWCASGDVFIVDNEALALLGSNSRTILQTLESLGAEIVRKPDLPSSLAVRINTRFGFDEVVKYLAGCPHRFRYPETEALVIERDQNLGWAQLATWIRNRFEWHSDPDQVASFLQNLLIWPAWSKEDGRVLVSLDSLKMLPNMVFELEELAPYLPSGYFTANATGPLRRTLKVEQMRFTTLFDKLTFPLTLNNEQLALYLNLLMKRSEQAENAPRPLVPNTDSTLRPADTLFSRDEPIFLGTLERYQRECLVHPNTPPGLCPLLRRFRLKDHFDFDSFRFCLGVFDQHAHEGDVLHIAQAVELYKAYRERLTWQQDAGGRWSELDEFRFIPRHENRCPYDLPNEAMSLIRALPSVVRPSEIVLDTHERVAWSQRARIREARQPDDRLRASHKTLGVPTVEGVIQHLRVLREIALIIPELNSQLRQDLKETYQFLSANREEAGRSLLAYKEEDLFLNVENLSDTPHWVPSAKLIFNALDDKNFREVRSFLKPHEDLILAAGGKKINAASFIHLDRTPAEETLLLWRSKLNRLRMESQLTDIVFVDSARGEHGAHRTLLVCLGDHFEALLTNSGMMEAGDNAFSSGAMIRVEMPDYDGAAIQTALGYMYTGDIANVEVQTLLDVLKLSDYWQVEDMKLAVQEALVPHITHNTYFDIKPYAQDYQGIHLLESCEEFERNNRQILNELSDMLDDS